MQRSQESGNTCGQQLGQAVCKSWSDSLKKRLRCRWLVLPRDLQRCDREELWNGCLCRMCPQDGCMASTVGVLWVQVKDAKRILLRVMLRWFSLILRLMCVWYINVYHIHSYPFNCSIVVTTSCRLFNRQLHSPKDTCPEICTEEQQTCWVANYDSAGRDSISSWCFPHWVYHIWNPKVLHWVALSWTTCCFWGNYLSGTDKCVSKNEACPCGENTQPCALDLVFFFLPGFSTGECLGVPSNTLDFPKKNKTHGRHCVVSIYVQHRA